MEHVTVADLVKATGGKLLCGDPGAEVCHIKLDSRKVEPGDLFVPLLGEKVDAHKFIPQVIRAGAAAVFTSEHDQPLSIAEMGQAVGNGKNSAVKRTEVLETVGGAAEPAGEDLTSAAWICVDDTKKALQDLGRYMRARLSLPLVGVTGSVGKTTTRELIAAALSARYRTYKTPGNSNSQVGVPITLSEISEKDQVGVIELGMSEPGELTIIAQIARPQMAVITNIGITHIEQLGSRENIYKEKMTIQDGLPDGGVLILNGDDDMLRATKGRDGLRTVYYGTGENCDFRAEQIVLHDGKPEFVAVHGDERQVVRLSVLGKHNVMNALAAIAVCHECGMTMEEAAKGLLTFQGFRHRQQVFSGKRFTILDDSYNASPASMRAAFDVFKEIGAGRRHVAVLADMKELGEKVLLYHREVGVYAAETGVDLVVTLGEACHALAEGVREEAGRRVTEKSGDQAGVEAPDTQVVEFLDIDGMTAYLEKELCDGDCILFKGSNSMGLSALADRFVAGDR